MAPTDTTTEATTGATTPPETAPETKKTKKKTGRRGRKPLNYALGWINETEAEKDEDGNEIPGTSREVFVRVDMPPGLDEAGARNRDVIERACRKAVYEKGLEEFGNKEFVVIAFGDKFSVPFERTTITQLLPPDKAEKVRARNGKGAVVVTDVEPQTSDEQEGGEV